MNDHLNQPATTIFLHIPKTAGTTLYHLLEQQYPPGQFHIVADGEDGLAALQALPTAEKEQIRLLAGHFSFGVHQHMPQPTTYFTILRQPVALVISYFYYLRTQISHPHFHLAKSMNLRDFLDSQIDMSMSNVQTRMLAGKPNFGPYLECTEDDLAIAKENLHQSFAVVGLTERFDETLLLLGHTFGWQQRTYARMNVTRKKRPLPEMDPQWIMAVTQANQFDLLLYDFASELFAEQMQQQGADFARQVRAFQRRNQLLYPFRFAAWQARRQKWLLQRDGALWLRDFYARGRNRLRRP